jgi:glucosamine--fructose-6-phosphate aminotransferase (isomerizing)
VESNVLRDQVFSLPALILGQTADLEPKVRTLFSTPELFSFQKIILSGCGDSRAAAMAVQKTFERLTCLPVEMISVIDLARFYEGKYFGFAPNNPLVILISNSGTVARVVEAARRAVEKGAFVLGITGNPDSPLGTSATRVLPLEIPLFPAAPGTRSYIVSLMALLLVAIRMGEVRGCRTMNESHTLRSDIIAQAADLDADLLEIDKKMLTLARIWQHLEAWDFVGAGPDYATAWYGHAKVLEATGQYAMHANSEEWLHLNFFAGNPEKIATVVISSLFNEGSSRTAETVACMRSLGRPLLLISDEYRDDRDAEGIMRVHPPSSCSNDSIPIVQCVPINLLVGYIMTLRGEKPGRDCAGPWAFAKDGGAIRNSEIIFVD